MNAQPHAHTATIEREYPSLREGRWMLRYGDTRVTICRESRSPNERLVRRATRKAVREHDRGSRAAGAAQERLDRLQALAEVEAARVAWSES